jgi:cell division protein FtsB
LGEDLRMAIKRKKDHVNRIALFGITVVVVSLAAVIGVRSQSLKEREQSYITREERLNSEIKAEENRTNELNEYKVYVKTKQYIEEIAKEKLGLVNPDEIILKESED